jgi:Glycosyl transferases group 1
MRTWRSHRLKKQQLSQANQRNSCCPQIGTVYPAMVTTVPRVFPWRRYVPCYREYAMTDQLRALDERPHSAVRKPILSTLYSDADVLWNTYVDILRRRDGENLAQWLHKFWVMSRGREALVLRGTVSLAERYRDLIAAAMLRFRSKRPLVIISDATIEPGSRALTKRLGPFGRLLPLFSRALIKAADGPHVRWCVLSTAELDTFSTTWGIARERILFTPFCTSLRPSDTAAATSDQGFLFSGGNSLRDYDLLVDAVSGTTTDVLIATSWQPPESARSHVRVGWLSHDDFMAAMRSCHAVVLPLASAVRSTGQQTYLNAMAYGKPLIVTDSPGVRDYIEDGVTGVVVSSDASALAAAIDHVMDPANAPIYAAMGDRARRLVRADYNDYAYRRRLLGVTGVTGADVVLSESPNTPPPTD